MNRSAIGLVLFALTFAASSNAAETDQPSPMIDDEQAIKIAQQVTFDLHGIADPADDISREAKSCIGDSPDMSRLGGCLQYAYLAYDVVLNAVYKHVLAETTNSSVKDAVIASERRWVSFHESEKKALDAYERAGLGTIGPIVVLNHELSLIRERISELMTYTHIHEG